MISIQDICRFMATWKQMTYRKGLEYCYSIKNDEKAFNICVEVIDNQNLTDKYMDGTSVQNLPIINEGKTKVIFSDIFWSMADSYISPAAYVAMVVKQCEKQGVDDLGEITGTVGRGLRAFPSFLREMDLAYKISKILPDAIITNDPNMDVKEHTDILISSKDKKYRFWSYQSFERGLTNTAQRFYGNRGSVPYGVHVLCPIDIGNENEVELIDGWCLYSERYVQYLVDMIEIEKPDKYRDLRALEEYALKMYLKKANVVVR